MDDMMHQMKKKKKGIRKYIRNERVHPSLTFTLKAKLNQPTRVKMVSVHIPIAHKTQMLVG